MKKTKWALTCNLSISVPGSMQSMSLLGSGVRAQFYKQVRSNVGAKTRVARSGWATPSIAVMKAAKWAITCR